MSELIVRGGNKLFGEMPVQGAKNSVLPLLAATLLTRETCVLHNCPTLSDVAISREILTHLGCRVTGEGQTVTVCARDLSCADVPEGLMRQMRSSIVFLGAIIARMGEASMSTPGGCELGNRPIDLHIMALKKLGVTVNESGGFLACSCRKLRGCEIVLNFPSVGATENILLASVLANGTTVIRNAAREPEISDLAALLNKMGASVHGAGEGTVTVHGVKRLHGCEHTVIPDRIAAATFLAAAAVTGGDVTLTNLNAEHLSPVLHLLSEMGCRLLSDNYSCRLIAPPRLLSVPEVRTMPYPGFPTDAQAPLMAAACVAKGTTVFVESIFDSRYKHVAELNRLGADIRTEGRTAVVRGVKTLIGASVECTDLRGGAALVIASLAAEGETHITRLSHLDRGYDRLTERLRFLGAEVSRR